MATSQPSPSPTSCRSHGLQRSGASSAAAADTAAITRLLEASSSSCLHVGLVGLKTFSGSVITKQIQSSAVSPPSSLSHLRPPTEADKNALARENWCGEVSLRTFLTAPRGCYLYKWGYFLVQKHDTQLVWV